MGEPLEALPLLPYNQIVLSNNYAIVAFMKSKEKHILEIFKHLVEQRVRVTTFALFGSRARGDAVRYSDMDVLVVVDQLDSKTADFISECAWESSFGSGIVVVPISYSKAEWEGIESQSLLAANIKAEGIFL
jgi:predicted nucleotidyltransferase